MKKKFEKMTCWAIENKDGELVRVAEGAFICTYERMIDAECCLQDDTERPIHIDIVRHVSKRKTVKRNENS